ncbi:MAG TPA: mersacidin/lichenicidin family type 2 lantibiotic [Thermoanaerobaculia bacterium]|nr:mersacidin/lichenicidin family type 2 lantibiotic [Thermoanaerobaculia bacterium]
MRKIDVVRAWRDEEYRNSLSSEQRASLPENPAGLAGISDDILRSVTGGCTGSYVCQTYKCCSTPDCSCVQPGTQCP